MERGAKRTSGEIEGWCMLSNRCRFGGGAPVRAKISTLTVVESLCAMKVSSVVHPAIQTHFFREKARCTSWCCYTHTLSSILRSVQLWCWCLLCMRSRWVVRPRPQPFLLDPSICARGEHTRANLGALVQACEIRPAAVTPLTPSLNR